MYLIRELPVNFCISSFLCSFSQIILQKNRLTGFLFIVGIGVNSPLMLLGASIAILSALVIAKLLDYDADAINSGLYGFNAALAGIATLFFLPVSLFSFSLVAFAGGLSSVIMHFIMHRHPKLPALTAPFVISTWLVLLIIETFSLSVLAISPIVTNSGEFHIVMRGIGQIMFQGYWLSGVFITVGLIIHSYKAAACVVIGSVGGMLIARSLNFSEDIIVMGLYGFNASLTAIGLSDRYVKNQWVMFIGIVLSVLFTWAFNQSEISGLTAPFVLAMWVIIFFVKGESNDVLEAPQS